MLYATNRFPGDGMTTQYEISFVGGYLDRTHVKAYVEGADLVQTPVTLSSGNFLGQYTIGGLAPVPVGSTLVIYRDTPKAPIVDFVNGSRFTETNLDTATRQGSFIAAEGADAVSPAGLAGVIQQVADFSAAAGVARDQAVAAKDTVVAASDAASLSASNANDSALSAAADADLALNSKNLADTAAFNASTSASQAQGFRDTASTHATDAGNSATAAAGSATTASNAQAAVALSATNAAASAAAAASTAQQVADNTASALASKNAAAASALSAATSATQSANSATAAGTAKTAAETARDSAISSATTAGASAATATTQAGIATSQATQAANSATTAGQSQTAAATSATNAAASAASATTSALTVVGLAGPMQCRVVVVNAGARTVRLERCGGTLITINGQPRTIPAAGIQITLGNSSSPQHLWAGWDGTQVTLVENGTAPVYNTTLAQWVYPGNPNFIPVAYVRPDALATPSRFLRNYYNGSGQYFYSQTLEAEYNGVWDGVDRQITNMPILLMPGDSVQVIGAANIMATPADRVGDLTIKLDNMYLLGRARNTHAGAGFCWVNYVCTWYFQREATDPAQQSFFSLRYWPISNTGGAFNIQAETATYVTVCISPYKWA